MNHVGDHPMILKQRLRWVILVASLGDVVAGRAGRQRLTCRALAVITLGFGALPMVMDRVGGTVAPSWWWVPPFVLAASVAVTGMWLRSTWPSRGLSRLAVLLTTGCIAAACLAVTDPLIGIMAAPRSSSPPSTSACSTLCGCSRSPAGGATPVGRTSWWVVQYRVDRDDQRLPGRGCATAIGLVNPPDRRGDDLEHVTGLLTPDRILRTRRHL